MMTLAWQGRAENTDPRSADRVSVFSTLPPGSAQLEALSLIHMIDIIILITVKVIVCTIIRKVVIRKEQKLPFFNMIMT